MNNAIEFCSGIGALGEGLEHNGYVVKVRNELKQPYAELMKRQGFNSTVVGDIGCNQTIAMVHQAFGESSLVAAGYPCQPWSPLGDRQQTSDDRGKTLHSVLRAAFFLRSHTLILECVTQAKQDSNILRTLYRWCKITGYNAREITLDLQDVWPARRSRWWVVLSFPGTNPMVPEPLPKLEPSPCIGDILNAFGKWPKEQMKQLLLDQYDTRNFQDYGGLQNSIVDMQQPMRTALHSIGNQLIACPCGCRNWPMKLERLQRQGLHGILVPTQGTIEAGGEILPQTRFIHPWELAFANGLKPNKEWMPNLRLSLSGIGQMASPLQSGWIASLHRWANHDHTESLLNTPEQSLWNQLDALFAERNQMFPIQRFDQKLQEFSTRLRNQLADASQSRRITRGLYTSEDIPASLTAHVEHADLHSHRSPSECEMIAHEERSPDRRSAISLPAIEDGVVDSPPPTPDQPEPSEWERFQEVRPDDGNVEHGLVPTIVSRDEETNIETQRWQQIGAVPGFQVPPQTTLSPTITATWPDVEPAHMDVTAPEHAATPEVDSPTPTGPCEPETVTINVCSVHSPSFLPLEVKKGTTIAEILSAENSLQMHPCYTSIANAIGVDYEESQVVQDNMWLLLKTSNQSDHQCATRLQQMFAQGSWVATDEMVYYLSQLSFGTQMHSHGVLAFDHTAPSTIISEQLCRQIASMLTEVSQGCVRALMVLLDGHWIPFVIDVQHGNHQISTTEEGTQLLDRIEQDETWSLPNDLDYMERNLPVIFKADCGFQSIVWLTNVVGALLTTDAVARDGMTVLQAEMFRLQFHSHLMATGRGLQFLPNLMLGGMIGTDNMTVNLAILLEQHGVPTGESHKRAADVINHLGRQAVMTCLRSSKAWRDLKAKCNAHTPRLQLVLPGELSEQIRARAESGKPIPSMKKKQTQPRQPKISLLPEDIQVPEGIFQHSGTTSVGQIPLSHIGPEAQGVTIATAQEAAPFLQMSQPISSKGLAILILDHTHESVKTLGCYTRFPARCTQTNEPMIVSARLINLGQLPIARSQPNQKMSVEESETFVLRITAFKDELDQEWESFTQRPVKAILTELGLTGGTDGDTQVVDVWDRQWLTHKMGKSQPTNASLFAVNLRLTNVSLRQLLSKSGVSGLYAEPRDESGRQTHEDYRVVWLPNLSKGETMAALQTSPHWTSLIRHGNRYGLRTCAQHAESIHTLHKPKVPYLSSAQLRNFSVGPMPFNCTRTSLSKMFELWGWKARAIQPKGRAVDGTGVLWQVQAEHPPVSEVFQMNHSDVIITEDDGKTRPGPSQPVDVLASAKTVAALRKKPQVSDGNPQQDPWANYDPWYTTSQSRPKQMKSAPSELTQQQLLALEDHMTERIKQAVIKDGAPDAVMTPVDDPRISALENRMQQVEQTIQQNAQIQTQQHQELTHHIATVQKNLDGQTQSVQQLLDNRFGEQLDHIERLLAKRMKTEDKE
eukprot:Skav222607  [mRNA]  locus=scaffold5038:168782:173185:- [translate_table: standard]